MFDNVLYQTHATVGQGMENWGAFKDWITFGIALLGAGLGILNYWNAISQRRVRLRVRPTYALAVPAGETMFSIEVVNLSNFAVTITEVGFTLDGRTAKKTRAGIPKPIIMDGQPWPRRLQSREAVSAFLHPGEVYRAGGRIGRAYAHTSCGEFAYGTSPALRQLSKIIDEGRARK